MNTPPPDGGPAFPVPNDVREIDDGTGTIQAGMTLRDWFAGQALVGILSNHEFLLYIDKRKPVVPTIDIATDNAYAIADSMLKASGRV